MDRIAQATQKERAELFRRSAGVVRRSDHPRSSRRISGSAGHCIACSTCCNSGRR